MASNYIDPKHKHKPVFYILCYICASVLCVLAFVGIAWAYTKQYVTPMYRASVTFVVNNSAEQLVNPEYIADADLTASQKLVDTYVTLIKSDMVLGKVQEAGNFEYSPSQLRDMITAEQVEETEIFTVSVSNPDPVVAAEIANTIAMLAPKECANIITGSSAKVIDYAKQPVAPYAPNYIKNASIGALVGMLVVIILGLCFVIRLFIKRKTAERKNYERRSQ